MKKKDLSVIIVVAIVSAVISYFLAGFIISSPKDRTATVEVIAPISPDFSRPTDKYFNERSINPTQPIIVQPEENPNPFGP